MSVASRRITRLCEHLEKGGTVKVLNASSNAIAKLETLTSGVPINWWIYKVEGEDSYVCGDPAEVYKEYDACGATLINVALLGTVLDSIKANQIETPQTDEYINFQLRGKFLHERFRGMNLTILGIPLDVQKKADKTGMTIEVDCTKAQFGLWIARRYEIIKKTKATEDLRTQQLSNDVAGLKPKILKDTDDSSIHHNAREWEKDHE